MDHVKDSKIGYAMRKHEYTIRSKSFPERLRTKRLQKRHAGAGTMKVNGSTMDRSHQKGKAKLLEDEVACELGFVVENRNVRTCSERNVNLKCSQVKLLDETGLQEPSTSATAIPCGSNQLGLPILNGNLLTNTPAYVEPKLAQKGRRKRDILSDLLWPRTAGTFASEENESSVGEIKEIESNSGTAKRKKKSRFFQKPRHQAKPAEDCISKPKGSIPFRQPLREVTARAEIDNASFELVSLEPLQSVKPLLDGTQDINAAKADLWGKSSVKVLYQVPTLTTTNDSSGLGEFTQLTQIHCKNPHAEISRSACKDDHNS